MVRRVSHALALAAAVGLLASGCGGSGGSSAPTYTAKATAPCLRQHGFRGVTTDPLQVGFIAASAMNGGLRATARDGNVLTIAFAQDETSAVDTEKAFRLHAPKGLRPHLTDIMESQGNAVLVWTITPKQRQLEDVLACLAES